MKISHFGKPPYIWANYGDFHPVGIGRLWWTQVATLRIPNVEASTSHFVWENKGKVARKIWETMTNPIEMEVFMAPSGKHTKKIWKDPPCLMGKSIIYMAIFNSYVTNYQRVYP